MTNDEPSHLGQQRKFYDSLDHEHLRPQEKDEYATKLVNRLAHHSGISTDHRILEVGAGFGRFSFPLLNHCKSVVALDLSQRVLQALESERDRRGIPSDRCRTVCGNVETLAPKDLGLFDYIVGFFILHHLPSIDAAISNLTRFLSPGGSMSFLEPNRRNPLFLAQVACCADMTWQEEKGMFQLSAKGVGNSFAKAGLVARDVERFGFFPPQIFNRLPAARRLESRLERSSLLAPVLPFLLLSGHDSGNRAQ